MLEVVGRVVPDRDNAYGCPWGPSAAAGKIRPAPASQSVRSRDTAPRSVDRNHREEVHAHLQVIMYIASGLEKEAALTLRAEPSVLIKVQVRRDDRRGAVVELELHDRLNQLARAAGARRFCTSSGPGCANGRRAHESVGSCSVVSSGV